MIIVLVIIVALAASSVSFIASLYLRNNEGRGTGIHPNTTTNSQSFLPESKNGSNNGGGVSSSPRSDIDNRNKTVGESHDRQQQNEKVANPLAPAQKTQINIISSPAAMPFVEKWIAQYNNEKNLGNAKVSFSGQVDDPTLPLLYSNYSSFLNDHSADLAISGSLPHAARGNFTYAGSTFLPVSPQAVAIVYNIPGLPDVPSGLKLDATTLSAILNGQVTKWNDPKIKALNSNTNLPNERIIVIHEAQPGSSASVLLGQYLALTSTSRTDRALQESSSTVSSPSIINTIQSIKWPKSGLTAATPESLSATVRQTPYSIGYLDFAFAAQTRMTFASLKNLDGNYYLPSIDSIAAAVHNGTVIDSISANTHLGSDNSITTFKNNSALLQIPKISVGHLGNGSYPIVGFYYAVFPKEVVDSRISMRNGTSTLDPLKSAAILDLLRWCTIGDEGKQVLKDIQYPSIYERSKTLKDFAEPLLSSTRNGISSSQPSSSSANGVLSLSSILRSSASPS